MQENLVIVESPAKAKKIEKFLGGDFVVKSSFGHIRDLVKKGLGIDVEKGYELTYEVPEDKKKIVAELKSLVKKAKHVWLASDEDREGEAIAWHLTQVLDLDVETTKRIVFHEITQKALLEAVANPRTVDLNLVNAQQARRVIDRLVGFELSPVLWRKVRPQLSAGRVQSVAVRLLVAREREIIGFESAPYYRVVAQFNKEGDTKASFKAELNKRIATKEEAEELLRSCQGVDFKVTNVDEKPLKRYPAPPFTTPTLQQEASRKLGMSVSQTMSVAQSLYEQGLITYMRTDSVNLSQQALAMCREQIIENYGEKYSSPINYKTKSKGAQEAHEAIRPSYIDKAKIDGKRDEKRLYELIWKRTVASQMVAAEFDRTVVTIEKDGGKEPQTTFVATGEVLRFDGFMKLYTESTDDDNNDDTSHEGRIPQLTAGEKVERDSITATQRYTQSPSRYNEAMLVKRLVELGIGRPSTYAPIITTIITRGYVVKQSLDGAKRDYTQLSLSGDDLQIKEQMLSESYGSEKNRLAPTDIAMLVNDYLESQFSEILDYNFTANVEKEFDRVAEGEISWDKMIDEFYRPFHTLVDKAVETQTTRSTHEKVLGVEPKSGLEVKARIGRYGPMVEIAAASEDAKPRFAALKKGQLIESITLEQALELFALPRTLGEFEGVELVVGIGRFGPYVRDGKNFTSLAKSDDPYSITLERAIELVVTNRAAKLAANTPLKTFEQEPELEVKSGRYGPYIAYKGKNYKIPRGTKPEEITLEQAHEIIAKATKK